MTWVKLGAEFNSECALQGLSDAAYRTHSEAIGWLYEVEDTSCRIPKRLFRRFAASDGAEAAVEELIAASFWKDAGAVWVLVHHASVIRQSIAAQQDKRKRDQKAQRRYRQKVSADVSADVNDESAATQSDRQTVGRKTTAAAKNNYQDQDQGQKKASGGGAAGQEEAAAGPARVDPPPQTRKIGEFTTDRIPVVPTISRSQSRYFTRAKPQTVTRARATGRPVPDRRPCSAVRT